MAWNSRYDYTVSISWILEIRCWMKASVPCDSTISVLQILENWYFLKASDPYDYTVSVFFQKIRIQKFDARQRLSSPVIPQFLCRRFWKMGIFSKRPRPLWSHSIRIFPKKRSTPMITQYPYFLKQTQYPYDHTVSSIFNISIK